VMKLQQMHRDAVLGIPGGAHVLCSNDNCDTQGFYIPGQFVSVQGHPEFAGDVVTQILLYREEQGILTPELVREGMRRAFLPNDGVAVARDFLRFIEDASL